MWINLHRECYTIPIYEIISDEILDCDGGKGGKERAKSNSLILNLSH